MEYNFSAIEKKWQQYWKEKQVYKVTEETGKPKYYVLDMFPYPSGAGLHVGHPLGYIASDIFSRYKRLKGFNVLHPMGYDAYGLPAEQYAIQTGQHPAVTTERNIARYREQLDKIGFSFDWDRAVKTCEPGYYKWTQWAFIQMFNSYFDTKENKAKPISELVAHFAQQGTRGLTALSSRNYRFNATDWNRWKERKQQGVLMDFRMAYLGNTMVNWCPALGTVLANDEVIDGLSERGGHPVEQKVMQQWCLRVSAYAQRLLDGLETVDWTDSLKETQRHWIGRSEGAEMKFKVKDSKVQLEIFTTRADTVFGVTFMVLAPESVYVQKLVQAEQREAVQEYLKAVKKRTERERIADRTVTGVFTGAYAINPFTNEEIPIWVSDYVLAGYGTGAIMAVPAHDSRDYAFAREFGLPIRPLIEGCDVSQESFDAKEGVMINSGFLDGLQVPEAIKKAKAYIKEKKLGKVKVNYRLRDAIFSRQRYWGEPFPVYYKDGMPYMLPESELPLELPEVDNFLPTKKGEPPLGHAKNWVSKEGYPLELNTMPGFAGSSAYYLRYMDPHNNEALVARDKVEYWQNVDLYLGGTEHATGHLIYSRYWNMFLYDIGVAVKPEPFQKLINQGMIQGRTSFVYRKKESNIFVSAGLKDQYDTMPLRVDVNLVSNDVLDVEAFRKWRLEYADAEFVLEDDGRYLCGYAVEKMSKSYHNVVNPDDIVERYGADTLRMYEMFLGPLELSKPWDTNGIDGVHRFLRKFFRLFFNAEGKLDLSAEQPTAAELKALHKTIKKVEEDIEHFSFNTSISAFMICVNELTDLKCRKQAILEPLTALLAPFAPHVCEELWQHMGHSTTICDASFPQFDAAALVEDSFEYPVSFNGKLRFKKTLPLGIDKAQAQSMVMEDTETSRFLDGKPVKNFIYVPGKIINIVC